MKVVARVALVTFAALLALLGAGMQRHPVQTDRTVGMVVTLMAFALIVLVFVHWQRTAVATPPP